MTSQPKLEPPAYKVADLHYPGAYVFEKREDGWYWNLKELVDHPEQWTGPFDSKRQAVMDCGSKE